MPAILIMKRRIWLDRSSLLSLVVWDVTPSVRGSNHRYKYRLAYIVQDVCVLRYDNEAGKGDHKHLGAAEVPIEFIDINQLVDDFVTEVNQLRRPL
ncbi:toxin-antitoxin system TumE family protein [Serratia sp. TSA_198.1]|uniref:toxin-antitoxin system TumE family protein n=1 Tax=Serratia sp. TSA_198.1 TaxID=3415664 RepID=UPI004046541B